MKEPTQIIIEPVLTEKSTALQDQDVLRGPLGDRRAVTIRKYTFKVAKDATKVDIRRAIEKLGNCAVQKVNTMVVKGKVRRRGRRVGRTSDWKKAIVTLREDETLSGVLGDAFEGM